MQYSTRASIFTRIGWQLTIPYFVVSVFIFFIITGLIFLNFNTRLNAIIGVQDEIGNTISNEITAYFQNILDDLNLFGTVLNTAHGFEEETSQKSLEVFLAHNPSIVSLTLLDLNGDELLHGGLDSIDSSVFLEYDVLDQIEDKGFFNGEVEFPGDQLPHMIVAVPVNDENNSIIGVLFTEVDLKVLLDLILNFKVEETGYVYIVDKSSNLIAYRDLNLLKQGVNLEYISVVKDFISRKQVKGDYVSFSGEKVVGVWKSINLLDWGVIVELPKSEVNSRLNDLILISSIAIFVFISFILVFLFLFYKQILNPIKDLKNDVLRALSVNDATTIRVSRKDEIGDLAAAFREVVNDLNKARKEVKNYSRELEAKIESRTSELQMRNEDLERFNSLIVGRELKMVELKNKIKELEEKLKVKEIDEN